MKNTIAKIATAPDALNHPLNFTSRKPAELHQYIRQPEPELFGKLYIDKVWDWGCDSSNEYGNYRHNRKTIPNELVCPYTAHFNFDT